MSKEKITDIKKQAKNSLGGKWKRAVLAFFIFLVIFGVLLAALGFGYQYAYAEKFYPGVKIAGFDVSGDDRASAEQFLKLKTTSLGNQNIKINTDQGIKTISLKDLGVEVDVAGTVSDAYNFGREANLYNNITQEFKALFNNKNFPLKLKYSDKINEKLKEIAPNLDTKAQDAQFKYQDGQVLVENEQTGKTIDVADFKTQLNKTVENTSYNTAINLKTTFSAPKISKAQVEELKPFYSQIISDNIILVDQSVKKSYTAKTENIAKWVNVKEKNNQVSLAVNSDEIKNYLVEIAKKVNKKVIDKKINAQTNAVITEGQDGKILDENKLLSNIEDIITKRIYNMQSESGNTIILVINEVPREEVKVQPEEIATGGGTAGMANGKYIEVNLTHQMLYLYNTDVLAAAYQVSTGKWSTPTPVGTRYIEDKIARAWSQEYGLYMPYWNGIGGGYGIHELPEWPGGYKEGEAHLGTPVSHGCIRLGVGPAEFVYNWASIGTPVFIHR
ncbi:MAG: L,D-transpeptidase/peptidoglycan binding protein [Patescibacteria group bacterium]|nr:L,D-transpeptidase/peptidoglycan binding protein [Patescibacteria group bacterium]